MVFLEAELGGEEVFASLALNALLAVNWEVPSKHVLTFEPQRTSVALPLKTSD